MCQKWFCYLPEKEVGPLTKNKTANSNFKDIVKIRRKVVPLTNDFIVSI